MVHGAVPLSSRHISHAWAETIRHFSVLLLVFPPILPCFDLTLPQVTPTDNTNDFAAYYNIPSNYKIYGFFRPTGSAGPDQLNNLGERLNLLRLDFLFFELTFIFLIFCRQGDPDANFRVPLIPVDIVRFLDPLLSLPVFILFMFVDTLLPNGHLR